jgi:hypothetical protein
MNGTATRLFSRYQGVGKQRERKLSFLPTKNFNRGGGEKYLGTCLCDFKYQLRRRGQR